MSSKLIEAIDAYYEAKKPYTALLREVQASSISVEKSQDPRPSSKQSSDKDQEGSSNVDAPSDEVQEMLEKLRAARLSHSESDQNEKTS